jgi:pimeloyl-ACP methyl ester carboxylesterase
VSGAGNADWPAADAASVLSKCAEVRGKRIRYVDIGSGPPIVFVHGTGGSWEVWRANISELAHRHRVVAVDLPGFGESEPLDGRASLAASAQVLSELLRMLNLGPAIVVGHSLGGIVCLHLALDHEEQVTSLVLVDSGGAPISGGRKVLITAGLQIARLLMGSWLVMKSIHDVPWVRRYFFGFVVRYPDSADQRLLDGAFLTMRAPGVAGAIIAGATDSVGRRLPDIEVPTLLLWGEFDRLLPVRLARQMADLMTNARLQIIEDCGHSPNIEYPQKFNHAVENWSRVARNASAVDAEEIGGARESVHRRHGTSNAAITPTHRLETPDTQSEVDH